MSFWKSLEPLVSSSQCLVHVLASFRYLRRNPECSSLAVLSSSQEGSLQIFGLALETETE